MIDSSFNDHNEHLAVPIPHSFFFFSWIYKKETGNKFLTYKFTLVNPQRFPISIGPPKNSMKVCIEEVKIRFSKHRILSLGLKIPKWNSYLFKNDVDSILMIFDYPFP